jgi:hypothetical protein
MSTTTTLSETASAIVSSVAAETPAPRRPVYGCTHVQSILEKHGERTRQEYDSIMSVVIQPRRGDFAKVKVYTVPQNRGEMIIA